ncbi:DoxX family protein [Spirosoma areae]
MTSRLASLSRFRDVGVLLLRLAFGFQLVKVSYKNALFPAENQPEFIAYLIKLGFPFPTVGAYLASYTEFIGGILLLLGLWTRWASLFLIINFSTAFLLAHIAINDTYQNTFPSANLAAVSFFLLLNGPGKYSIDGQWQRSSGDDLVHP